DGRFVAFFSTATNLVSDDSNSAGDVFVLDRSSGEIQRVSVASGGVEAAGGSSISPAISADGRFVAFASSATLVPNESSQVDVFVHDRLTRVTRLVSVASDGQPAMVNGSEDPAISVDGRYVAFVSFAPNLVPADTN